MVISYGWKGKRDYNIRKAYVLPYYGMKAQIALYLGIAIGIVIGTCINFSLSANDSTFTWIIGITTSFFITIISGPLCKCLVASILTFKKKYEEAWVITDGVGDICRVIYITKNTNRDYCKVLRDYLDKYTEAQIEKQKDYFSERYEHAFLNIH